MIRHRPPLLHGLIVLALISLATFSTGAMALSNAHDGDTVAGMFANPHLGPSTATYGNVRVLVVSISQASADRYARQLAAFEEMKSLAYELDREPVPAIDYSGTPTALLPKLQREDYGERHKHVAMLSTRAIRNRAPGRWAFARRGDQIRAVRTHC